MTGLFIYFLYTGLNRYCEHPVNTIVEYKRENEMDFPSVTLCNFNYINKSYVLDQDEFVQKVASILSLFPQEINWHDPNFIAGMKTFGLDRVGKDAAHSLDQTFSSCSFNDKKNLLSPCQFHKDLFVRRMTEMGYCYTFHPYSYIEKNGPLKVSRSGAVGGLMFQIDIHQDLYYIFQGHSAGMKVFKPYLNIGNCAFSHASLLY